MPDSVFFPGEDALMPVGEVVADISPHTRLN